MLVAAAVVWFLILFYALDPFRILVPFHYESLDQPKLSAREALTSSLERYQQQRREEENTKKSANETDGDEQTKKKKKNTRSYQSFQWRETRDPAVDYHDCVMYGPSPRPLHGCVVDNETDIPYCAAESLQIDLTKVHSGVEGGEDDLLDFRVYNRSEDTEFLSYETGTFVTSQSMPVPSLNATRDHFFYIDDILMATTAKKKSWRSKKCPVTFSKATLMVTRYEYVDLYHTIRDWWNTFFSLLPPKPVEPCTSDSCDEREEDIRYSHRVVFLDAHAVGQYDDVWETLFGRTVHLRKINAKRACFNKAIFVPPGYSSVLWPRHRLFSDRCHRCPSMAKAFAKHVLDSHGITERQYPMQEGLVTFAVRKNDYLRHPRSVLGDKAGVIKNYRSIAERITNIENVTGVDVVELEKLSFVEQLKVVRKTHILIGSDDMLSHVLFMRSGSHALDLTGNSGIDEYAAWNEGVTYHDIGSNLDKSGTLSNELYENLLLPAIKDVVSPGWDANLTRMDGMMDDFALFGGDKGEDPEEFFDSNLDTERESPDDYHDCQVYAPRAKPPNGCVVGSNGETPFCSMHGLVVDVSKIECSEGGEEIDTVMGREEEAEFPVYQPGAFLTKDELSLPALYTTPNEEQAKLHYIQHVLGNTTTSDQNELACDESDDTPTAFLTRYEYVDLIPTLSDWWNTFVMLSPTTSNKNNPKQHQVVFLDGHAKGVYDDAWEKLFGPVQHVMRLPRPETKRLCFNQASLVPPSYSSMLYNADILPCSTLADAFVDYVVEKLGCRDVAKVPGRVLVLEKHPFQSHPRLDLDTARPHFASLDVLKSFETESERSGHKVSVEFLRIDQTDFAAQVCAVRAADVLVGHAETDLPLLLFLQSGAHVVELLTNGNSMSIERLTAWKEKISHMTVPLFLNDAHELPQDLYESELLPLLKHLLLPNRTTTAEDIEAPSEGATAKDELTSDEEDQVEPDEHTTNLRKPSSKDSLSGGGILSWFAGESKTENEDEEKENENEDEDEEEEEENDPEGTELTERVR